MIAVRSMVPLTTLKQKDGFTCYRGSLRSDALSIHSDSKNINPQSIVYIFFKRISLDGPPTLTFRIPDFINLHVSLKKL